MKFTELFYCPHMRTLTAYWEGSLSKYSLPLSSYALSPTILLLLETFLELLLWNIFQCCHHIFWMTSISWNLHTLMADFIYGNSHKSHGDESGELGGFSISPNDFLVRNCRTESTLWAGALSASCCVSTVKAGIYMT